MKYVLLLVLAACLNTTQAQSTLEFCVEVGKDGKCLTGTTEFDVSNEGGTISVLLTADDSLRTGILRYKVYFLDNYGNEKLGNTFEQRTEPGWTYAWQDVVFYDPGTYKVKAYRVNEEEEFICSAIVKIFKQ